MKTGSIYTISQLIVTIEILESVNYSGLIDYMEELRDFAKGCQ